jgi:hypothetical protein
MVDTLKMMISLLGDMGQSGKSLRELREKRPYMLLMYTHTRKASQRTLRARACVCMHACRGLDVSKTKLPYRTYIRDDP